MKKFIILILWLFLGYVFVSAQTFAGKKEKIAISPPQDSLNIGEDLQYSLEWLGIPLGKISLNIIGVEKIGGHECYHIIAYAKTSKFLSILYDVEYTVHTYIDKNDFFTHRFEKIRVIKNKTNYVVIDFDREKNEVKYKSEGSTQLLKISSARRKIEKQNPITTKIPSGTQDLLSTFYYLRLIQLKEDKSYPMNIYYDQRNWPINIKTEQPFLKDIYKKGTFAVFGVSLASDLGTFILGKESLSVYFTADSRRIPLEFRLGTSLGPIRGIIQKIPPSNQWKNSN